MEAGSSHLAEEYIWTLETMLPCIHKERKHIQKASEPGETLTEV